jgi:hypothetical protein
MQTATPQAVPSAPAPTPRPTVVISGGSNGDVISIPTPMSARELEALKARRQELSNQLESVDGRRSQLMTEMKNTGDQTAIKGLEDRLALLDKRQLQLESDIATTGQQLSSASAGLAVTTHQPSDGNLGPGQIVAISIVGIIFICAPLAFGLMKMLLRRASKSPVPPAALTETAQRLERLEGAVDTIAVEIERISEGQRFVTKLLSEGHAPALASGKRVPDAVQSGN